MILTISVTICFVVRDSGLILTAVLLLIDTLKSGKCKTHVKLRLRDCSGYGIYNQDGQ